MFLNTEKEFAPVAVAVSFIGDLGCYQLFCEFGFGMELMGYICKDASLKKSSIIGKTKSEVLQIVEENHARLHSIT